MKNYTLARKVTLFTAQWGDMPLEAICSKAKAFGYDGLELSCTENRVDKRHQTNLPVRLWGDGTQEGVRQRDTTKKLQVKAVIIIKRLF